VKASAILFILPTNVAQGLIIMAAIVAGFTIPITAPQKRHGDGPRFAGTAGNDAQRRRRP
jgi:hypothetical protein